MLGASVVRRVLSAMKKLLPTGIAALFLATGAAHANDKLPEHMLGRWCNSLPASKLKKFIFAPIIETRES
jgi:hypothetical protein